MNDKDNNNDLNYKDNSDLEVNKKNSEEFDKVMNNASRKLDSYWDKNNPFVKGFLIVLLLIIILGAIYYITNGLAVLK